MYKIFISLTVIIGGYSLLGTRGRIELKTSFFIPNSYFILFIARCISYNLVSIDFLTNQINVFRLDLEVNF